MLEKSVAEKCWGRLVYKRIGEEFCREVLEKSVVEGGVVEKCWRRVL